ncbi:hypothetical protein C8R45DRAFT_1115223 [Mycena sanguinolenta]|nr:hypothetical protein C8R45DRAFT_1115223 [Mycena sanguinolenta]
MSILTTTTKDGNGDSGNGKGNHGNRGRKQGGSKGENIEVHRNGGGGNVELNRDGDGGKEGSSKDGGNVKPNMHVQGKVLPAVLTIPIFTAAGEPASPSDDEPGTEPP